MDAYNAPSSFIEGKIQPPQLSAMWLDRPTLLTLLEKASDHKLTLLHAPAGSGKSTALSQWYHQRREKNSIAWLCLEPLDNDVTRFFGYLYAAIKNVQPKFEGYIYSHLLHDDIYETLIVESLLKDLYKIDEPLFILLDDFQSINSRTILDGLERLLNHLPQNIHLIISSRRQPLIALAPLRLEEQLLVIDQQSLSFTWRDIANLGEKLTGDKLTEKDSNYLGQITEGWIAGIKLAILSHWEPQEHGIDFKKFDGIQLGAHFGVVEYLVSAVLDQLDPDLQSFLLQSSVLEKITGPLCDAILQTDLLPTSLLPTNRGQETLLKLYQEQLFLQPTDPELKWFRFHSLFREFLLSQLDIKYPCKKLALYRLASQWFMEQGDYDQSLNYGFLSKDETLIKKILSIAWVEWVKQGQFISIIEWSERIDDSIILAEQNVAIAYIASLILARRFNQADYYLEHLQEIYATNQPIDNTELCSLIEFLKLMLELFQNDTAFRFNRGYERISNMGKPTGVQAFFYAIHAYHLLLNQQYDRARSEATIAREYLLSAGHHYLCSFANLILIVADRAQGYMLDAVLRTEEEFSQQLKIHSPAWINMATALAVVRYEQSRLEEAESLCREILPWLSNSCATEVITSVYITLARININKGEWREAKSLLRHLSQILQLGSYDRFSAQVCNEQLRVAYQANDGEKIQYWLRHHGLMRRWKAGEWRKSRSYDECWLYQGLAICYSFIHSRRFHDALDILKNLALSAEKVGNMSRHAVAQANIMVCYWHLNEKDNAYRILKQTLNIGSLACFNRSVFDEAPGIEIVLTDAIQNHQLSEVPVIFLETFLAQDGLSLQTPSANQAIAIQANDRLTDKEAEILSLLKTGLTNQSISERLGVTLSTTKWHLKNIYSKLDVCNRTEAVHRAEKAGVI